MADDSSADLETQRRLAFERLTQLRNFYERPESAQLLTQMQGRASGTDSPFSGEVTSQMYGANADNANGQFGMEREAILRAMGNAGLGGSGLQANAMINARRRSSAAARSGRMEITSRAALGNFQAREQAQQQLMQYMQQRQGAEQDASFKEIDLRSQMRNIQDAPPQAAATAPGAAAAPQTQPNAQNRGLVQGYFGAGGGAFNAQSQYLAPTYSSFGGTGISQGMGLTSGAHLQNQAFQNQAQQAMMKALQGGL